MASRLEISAGLQSIRVFNFSESMHACVGGGMNQKKGIIKWTLVFLDSPAGIHRASEVDRSDDKCDKG